VNEGFKKFTAAAEKDRIDTFLSAAQRLGANAQYIEKDFWVGWTLDVLYHGSYACLLAACGAMTSSLARSRPLRGGIDAGLSMLIAAGEVYGPALERAYALEADAAEYCRIVIGDELWDILLCWKLKVSVTRTDKSQRHWPEGERIDCYRL
jgi:hypothetical protein